MSQLVTRKCTKCLETLPLDYFYSKGNRADSRCKECVKSTKKAKHVARSQDLQLNTLKEIFELVYKIESLLIEKHLGILNEEIKRCQSQ